MRFIFVKTTGFKLQKFKRIGTKYYLYKEEA